MGLALLTQPQVKFPVGSAPAITYGGRQARRPAVGSTAPPENRRRWLRQLNHDVKPLVAVFFALGHAGAKGDGTTDDTAAAPGLSLLSIRGRGDWRSGQGSLFLARGVLTLSGNAGGRFYGVMGMGRPFLLSGLTQPTSFYALNVERVFANPQSEFRDCAHLRIFYFKVEAGTVRTDNAGDGNTPGRITRCRDTRIYTMVGNVRHLGQLPMLEVTDSQDVVVAQLKSFQPSTFPHLTETHGAAKHAVPSTQPVALFVRD